MYEQLDIQGLLNNGSARSGTSALHQESSSHPRVKRNTPFDLEQQQQQGQIRDTINMDTANIVVLARSQYCQQKHVTQVF